MAITNDTEQRIQAALLGALAEADQADAKAAELAAQMNAWLRAPLGLGTPISSAGTELVEWCRAARDLLALMAGE